MKTFVWVCVLAACSDSSSGPTVRFALPASGVPQPLSVPWPSDVYLDSDGTIVDGLTDWSLVKVTNADPSALLAGYGALDGFGRASGALFSIDGLAMTDAIDTSNLPLDPDAGADPSSPVAFLDLESGARVPCTAGWDAFTRVLVVTPEDELAPAHAYAAIVTSHVKTTSGAALHATSAFAAIRDGARKTDAAMLYGRAVDAAVAAGIAKSEIVAATAYTTSARQKLHVIRDALAAGAYGPAPSLVTTNLYFRFGASAHPGWTATLAEWLGTPRKDGSGQDLTGMPGSPEAATTAPAYDAVAAFVTAQFVSPEFRRPFTQTGDYADGTIAFDSSGNAVPYNAQQLIPVSIVIPKGPAPASGFPVVIWQHGLGDSRAVVLGVMNELARAGIATFAIDAPLHGLRDPGGSDTESNGKGTYVGRDGLADSGNPLALLAMAAQLRNLIAARDNFWQAALDLAQLRRLVGNCDLSIVADEFGGVAPVLDTNHVAYTGWSMGGQIGAIFSGIEPRSSVNPFVLVAPGVATLKSFADSPVYNAATTLVAAQAGIPEQTMDANLYAAIVHLLQGAIDGIDGAAFAGDSDHDLWLVRAADDESIPARWSNVLARAYGASQLTPTLAPVAHVPQVGSKLGGARVVGLFETAPGGHGFFVDRYNQVNYAPPYPRDSDPRFVNLAKPFPIRAPVVGTQLAAIHFMQTTWAGAPEIDVGNAAYLGLLPVADTDDDGYCDSDETTAGTDPFDPTSHPSGTPSCVRDVGFTSP